MFPTSFLIKAAWGKFARIKFALAARIHLIPALNGTKNLALRFNRESRFTNIPIADFIPSHPGEKKNRHCQSYISSLNLAYLLQEKLSVQETPLISSTVNFFGILSRPNFNGRIIAPSVLVWAQNVSQVTFCVTGVFSNVTG